LPGAVGVPGDRPRTADHYGGGVLRIGLTGGIGSGKTAVAELLAPRGATVVDADLIAREVVEPGTPGLAAVVEAFGDAVLAPDGHLDRPALAAKVFGDEEALARLNGIVHPLVGARAMQLATEAAERDPTGVLVYDVPLLVENGLAAGFDLVLVVEAPVELRLERLERRGVPAEEAGRRMAAQADDAARREVADAVIVNDGDLTLLAERVARVWDEVVEPRRAR
jgi:dephospho-CoA kinase